MPAIAERITWAIDLLDIQPTDNLLEIRFGAGVAATLAAERLDGGTYTGIDRSRKMVAQATKRNRKLVEAGLVSFHDSPVHEFSPGDLRFTRPFMINVNLHLHDPERDFAAIRQMLAPEGLFLAVAHPPSEGKAFAYAKEMPDLLASSGFAGGIDVRYRDMSAGIAVAVLARPGEDA